MTETNNRDIKLAVTEEMISSVLESLKERTKILGKVGSYEFRSDYIRHGTDNFVGPQYDFSEIARALDVEAYVGRSVTKISEQVIKHGYEITGVDENMIAYIKNRLFEIALVTGIETDQILREITLSLVTYGNAYIILRRDKRRSSGNKIKMYGKTLQPIAGMFVADATTMECSVDKYGNVKMWKQRMDSLLMDPTKKDGREFPPEDVIHIYINRKSGFTYGTPYIIAALDDIRALRKLEEIAVVLSSKEAFPLYHYKVGLPDKPAAVYEDGTTEVDSVMSRIQTLPQQGFIVSNERLTIDLVSRKGGALDIKPFLEYFEDRVLSSLMLSKTDLGRSSSVNRGTASTISKNMQEISRNYQSILSTGLSFKLILPLLLEGNFDVTVDNTCHLKFPEIDTEEARSKENHGLNLFNGSVITLDEFRRDFLRRRPLSEKDKKNTLMYMKHELSLELNKESQKSAAEGTTENKARPTNQYGKSPSKPKVAANDYNEIILDGFNKILLGINREENKKDLKSYIQSFIHDIINQAEEATKLDISEQIKKGWEQAKLEFEAIYKDSESEAEYIGSRALDRFYKNFVHKSYWKVIEDHLEAIYKCIDKEEVDIRYIVHLENARLALKDLVTTQQITANRFGFVSYAKRMGCKSVEVLGRDNNALREISLEQIIYTNLLPKEKEERRLKIKDND